MINLLFDWFNGCIIPSPHGHSRKEIRVSRKIESFLFQKRIFTNSGETRFPMWRRIEYHYFLSNLKRKLAYPICFVNPKICPKICPKSEGGK